MTEIDWSKAPEGATHWCPKIKKWIFSNKGELVEHCCVPRPTEPEWNGEGWPPVGCECECKPQRLGSLKWERCKVIGPNGRFIVCLLLESGGFAQFELSHLRSMRTQDQKQRDEVIVNALRVAPMNTNDDIHPRQYLIDSLKVLYDAGFLRDGSK